MVWVSTNIAVPVVTLCARKTATLNQTAGREKEVSIFGDTSLPKTENDQSKKTRLLRITISMCLPTDRVSFVPFPRTPDTPVADPSVSSDTDTEGVRGFGTGAWICLGDAGPRGTAGHSWAHLIARWVLRTEHIERNERSWPWRLPWRLRA